MTAAGKPRECASLATEPVRIALPGTDIDVWMMCLDLMPVQVRQWENLLSDDEASRAARFHFERDRRRFIAARGTLRLLLGGYLEMAPAAIKFNYGATGKPAIAPPAGTIHFNLSHSGERALYAFSSSRPLGVDIEYLHHDLDHKSLSERFFSPAECAALDRLPDCERKRAFLVHWTRKEAVVKASGEGLSLPIDRLYVATPPGLASRPPGTAVALLDGRAWHIHAPEVGDDYTAAIAAATTRDDGNHGC